MKERIMVELEMLASEFAGGVGAPKMQGYTKLREWIAELEEKELEHIRTCDAKYELRRGLR